MDRKMMDCRTMPSERNCSLTITGTEDEVLDAATDHAVNAHGPERTAELREQLKSAMTDAEPAHAGHHACTRGATQPSAPDED